jgi:uncharacterized protein YbbC (DUF1343 family)
LCWLLWSALAPSAQAQPTPGAWRTEAYFPLLRGKRFAVVANQTSRIESTHLVDSLIAAGLRPAWIYAPEHGFRGRRGAGEMVESGRDRRTGLTIRSLYGSQKKPDLQDLRALDWIVFDIQDVGARFYTYLSSLHYVMEACAEAGTPLLLLDRPNPNGHYVDGPVLEEAFRSFVGMHPIPVVHGMTLGELAGMIQGEGWLAEELTCSLQVIACRGYRRAMRYQPPVPPSPNLPNWKAIALYPSLCFFEGTAVSVGRGTPIPFQCIGHPAYEPGTFSFTPQPVPQAAPHPKLEGRQCFGTKLQSAAGKVWRQGRLELSYLLRMHRHLAPKTTFFTRPDFFDLLAGTDRLRKQIQDGAGEAELRATWEEALKSFKAQRRPYLLYP